MSGLHGIERVAGEWRGGADPGAMASPGDANRSPPL